MASNTRSKVIPVNMDMDLLEKILDEKLGALATKEDMMQLINIQNELIKEQNSKIDKLESSVSLLQHHVKNLKQLSDTNEQYSRRTCLRILGIPPADKETGDECLEKVKKVFVELGVEIPDLVVDRAHRVGSKFKNKDGVEMQTVICKFTTWRHRTLVYSKRSASKKYGISLDLTKFRLELLKSAKEIVKSSDQVSYVYADINCQLCVKLKSGKSLRFDNENELEKLLTESAEPLVTA